MIMIQFLKFMNKYGYIVHLYLTIQFAIMSGSMATLALLGQNPPFFLSSAALGVLLSGTYAVFSYYSIRSRLMDDLYEKIIEVKND